MNEKIHFWGSYMAFGKFQHWKKNSIKTRWNKKSWQNRYTRIVFKPTTTSLSWWFQPIQKIFIKFRSPPHPRGNHQKKKKKSTTENSAKPTPSFHFPNFPNPLHFAYRLISLGFPWLPYFLPRWHRGLWLHCLTIQPPSDPTQLRPRHVRPRSFVGINAWNRCFGGWIFYSEKKKKVKNRKGFEMFIHLKNDMFIVNTHYIQKYITICRTGDDTHVYTSTIETKLILLHIYHIEIPPNTSSEKEVYKSLYHDTSPSLPQILHGLLLWSNSNARLLHCIFQILYTSVMDAAKRHSILLLGS